jgi:hypothetical protein
MDPTPRRAKAAAAAAAAAAAVGSALRRVVDRGLRLLQRAADLGYDRRRHHGRQVELAVVRQRVVVEVIDPRQQVLQRDAVGVLAVGRERGPAGAVAAGGAGPLREHAGLEQEHELDLGAALRRPRAQEAQVEFRLARVGQHLVEVVTVRRDVARALTRGGGGEGGVRG